MGFTYVNILVYNAGPCNEGVKANRVTNGIMKLSVPYNGDFEGLKEIIKSQKGEVYEVFTGGSPYYIGSVRGHLLPDKSIEETKKQIEYVHENGIEMSIVLNATCHGAQHLTTEGKKMFDWYLNTLNDIGADSVMVADPYFMELISREYDMKVVVSAFTFVNSPQKAVFCEEFGADVITVDTNVNRHFDMLKAMKESLSPSCKLKLIVNEGCLYSSPLCMGHTNFCSHANVLHNPVFPIRDYYHDKCMTMRIKNPLLIITSGWIRPEDMKEYEKIGMELFKVGGRGEHTNWIINTMKAYLRRSYDGNLMDLLDVPGLLRSLFYISNKDLEGAIEKWKECDKLCHRCSFCKELTDKVIKVYSMKGTVKEELKSLASIKNGHCG